MPWPWLIEPVGVNEPPTDAKGVGVATDGPGLALAVAPGVTIASGDPDGDADPGAAGPT